MNTNQRAFLASVTLLALAGSASAQVIVSEQFSYATQAELDANWSRPAGNNNVLTLDPGTGTASIPGTGSNPNIWSGSTFSLTPSDASPIRLTADISAPGNAGTVGTIGLRQSGGINPLFEMGLYRSFDNVQTGPDTTAIGAGTGIGVRTINVGTDLNAQDWVKMGDYYNGTARFEATFTATGVRTRIDVGIDGVWEFDYTENGTAQTAAFSDLRVHSPVASTAGAGGIIVDNIRLEVIPEPSTYALFALGAAGLAFARRRKA